MKQETQIPELQQALPLEWFESMSTLIFICNLKKSKSIIVLKCFVYSYMVYSNTFTQYYLHIICK